jgi:DNA-binding response OmpR family regulator
VNKRILVVEDDSAIREALTDALEFAKHEVLSASDAPRGLDLALRSNYDLLLLDLMLPGGNGFDILEELRRSRPSVPVIILTARGQESDRVQGLRMGADDYVVKPFSIRELLARVDAVLRRSAERPVDINELHLRTCVVDLARREARFEADERCDLTEREADLLRYLAANRGRAMTREEILVRVWRVGGQTQTRTIDMTVARLREKLRDPNVVETVRGKGYRFGVEASEDAP